MRRMRFHIALACTFAFGAVLPAEGQAARIDDIQLSQQGEAVSILVKLSRQPAAASAKAAGDDLIVEIDGVELPKLSLDPPPGSLVRHVESAGGNLTLSGAAFGEAATVIYRNAVLIEARLAEPRLRGASLMVSAASAPDAKPAVVEPHVIPAASASQMPIEQAKSLETHPSQTIAAAVPSPAPTQTERGVAALANIDTARCSAAALAVEKDPWAIPALGDHALCLIDQGKTKEGSNRLEQLAAFSPEDWRVALGRAALAAAHGDASHAELGYRTAALLAPDEQIRTTIMARLTPASVQPESVEP